MAGMSWKSVLYLVNSIKSTVLILDTVNILNCISGKPEKKIELTEKRGDAASVVLNQTMLWIVGGFTSINPKATEIVKLSDQ